MSRPLAYLRRCYLGALWLLLLAFGFGSAQATVSDERATVAVVGPVIGWGANTRGQLGTNPSARIARPMLVNELGGVIAVAAGADHSLALLRDGTVRAWGANDAGQLGDGTTLSRALPVIVEGLSDVIAIAAGGRFSLALRRDGAVFAWGRNNVGQLGVATSDFCPIDSVLPCSSHPLPVAGLSAITAIAAGGAHSLGLRQDGVVLAWGDNQYGQIGRTAVDTCMLGGTLSACARAPIPIVGLDPAITIAAGSTHSVAITADRRVQAWGDNSTGQVGEAATDVCTTQRRSCAIAPVTVPGVADAIAIAAGGTHSLALLQDGRVQAFGYEPELGLGTANPRPHPSAVVVPGLRRIVAIAVGRAFSVVTDADGRVWAWGLDDVGQLGYGLEPNDPCLLPRCTLVPAPALTHDLVAIAAGQDFVLAIQRTTLPGLPNTGDGWSATRDQVRASEHPAPMLVGWQP